MMRRTESVIKVVMMKERKWLIRSNQKVVRIGNCNATMHSVTIKSSGRKQASKLAYFSKRNVKTRYRSHLGRFVERQTDGGAGVGGWKKRKPSCNGSDTDYIRRESEPTSNWSFIAREGVGSIL
jgi:hypothetical protein